VESQQLRERDSRVYALLAARLEHLTAASSGRLGQPGMGRIRQLPIVTDSTWIVLFVERRDGRGLCGLLLHRCEGAVLDPPQGAYELARHRLSEMPEC
jgi:hypothetical protein